jgi:hypothetical protein
MQFRICVSCNSQVRPIEAADAFASMGIDNSFNMESFVEKFKVNIISSSDEEIVFDLVGIDAPIANAFRRILLSEVPTMAVEKVRPAHAMALLCCFLISATSRSFCSKIPRSSKTRCSCTALAWCPSRQTQGSLLTFLVIPS